TQLVTQLMMASLQQSMSSSLRVLDAANLPSSPSRPNRGMIVAAGMTSGLALGLAVTLARKFRQV
ncbi:MAG: GNVR domain-containing protein, partial [Acidobacteriota bacterium]